MKLGPCGISCDPLKRFSVLHKNVQVAEFIPDLIAFDSVSLDANATDGISDHERGEMISHLRITKLKVGRAHLSF